jgi:hypothetical protein
MTLPVYRTVDDAISCVARFTDGRTQEQTATEMGWTLQQLSKATDPNSKPRFAAAWIVPLTLTTGNFAIVRTICKLVGGVFFLPCRRASGPTHSARTLKEFSEYLGVIAKNEIHGYTRAQVDELENEMHDVIGCMLAHVDKLRAEAK